MPATSQSEPTEDLGHSRLLEAWGRELPRGLQHRLDRASDPDARSALIEELIAMGERVNRQQETD